MDGRRTGQTDRVCIIIRLRKKEAEESLAKVKYEEIADILRDRIADGVYPVDSLLPTQSELAKGFGASQMTMIKST